jgi:hypothetical protein
MTILIPPPTTPRRRRVPLTTATLRGVQAALSVGRNDEWSSRNRALVLALLVLSSAALAWIGPSQLPDSARSAVVVPAALVGLIVAGALGGLLSCWLGEHLGGRIVVVAVATSVGLILPAWAWSWAERRSDLWTILAGMAVATVVAMPFALAAWADRRDKP